MRRQCSVVGFRMVQEASRSGSSIISSVAWMRVASGLGRPDRLQRGRHVPGLARMSAVQLDQNAVARRRLDHPMELLPLALSPVGIEEGEADEDVLADVAGRELVIERGSGGGGAGHGGFSRAENALSWAQLMVPQ